MVKREHVIPLVLIALVFFVLFSQYIFLNPSGGDWRRIRQIEEENTQLIKLLKEQQLQISALQSPRETVDTSALATANQHIKDLSRRIGELERTNQLAKEEEKEQQNPKIKLFKAKLEEYTKLHNEITSGKLPPRYVECVLINGWGNALQEAVSCFLFALMSNRAAIFNTGGLDGYMPFRESFEKLPFDGYNMGYIRGTPESDKKTIPRFDLPCLNLKDVEHLKLITIHLTYDWYAPNLLVNPYHGEEMLEILPENYFQIIFSYLFKLKKDLQDRVDEVKAVYFKGYTVGIQIRNPTQSKDGKVDHKGFPVPPLNLYAQAAEQLARFQNKVPYENTKFFMATQNVDLVKKLQSGYTKDRIVFYNATITTTFERDLEGQKVSLVTWWLLGECDEVITTEVSSFGTTAAARTGLYPIVCTHHKYCFRRMSPTPCQDTPWLAEQPVDCLAAIRKYPHQYLTAPDNSCGFYKLWIYNQPEYQTDSWKIKQ